jgi:hypothetical protein
VKSYHTHHVLSHKPASSIIVLYSPTVRLLIEEPKENK